MQQSVVSQQQQTVKWAKRIQLMVSCSTRTQSLTRVDWLLNHYSTIHSSFLRPIHSRLEQAKFLSMIQILRGNRTQPTDLKILMATGRVFSGLIWQTVRQFVNFAEHFINWVKISGLPQFRKLYGVISDGLKEGKYTLRVNNNYPVS